MLTSAANLKPPCALHASAPWPLPDFYDIDVDGRQLSNRCGIPESALFPYQGLDVRVEVSTTAAPPNLRLTIYVPEGSSARFLSDSVVIQEPRGTPAASQPYRLVHADGALTGLNTATGLMTGKTVVWKSLLGDITSHQPYRFEVQPNFVAHDKDGAILLPGMEINQVAHPPLAIPYRATSKFVFAALNGC